VDHGITRVPNKTLSHGITRIPNKKLSNGIIIGSGKPLRLIKLPKVTVVNYGIANAPLYRKTTGI
jgi:hypothetical protein